MVDVAHPAEVGPTVADRLRATTVAHRDAQETAQHAAKAWRESIVDAIDHGMSYGAVAELAGVSRARVHHIIAGEYARA